MTGLPMQSQEFLDVMDVGFGRVEKLGTKWI